MFALNLTASNSIRASIEAARIKEGAEYEGVRVRFIATLAQARIPMQIDIGFGDVIVPAPTQVEYPTLLDFPAPVLLAYPKETVVAEKLEALTKLGLLNSRMKDYYDLALLSRLYSFNGAVLVEAIIATFRHRETPIETDPIGLTEAYFADPARSLQWRALFDGAASLNTRTILSNSYWKYVASRSRFVSGRSEKFLSLWHAAGPWVY